MIKSIANIVAILLMLTAVGYAASSKTIEIDLSVVDPDDSGTIDIYTPVKVNEGEWGGFEVVFYGNGSSYSMKSIEDVGDMVDALNPENIVQGSDNITLVVYIYLRPTITDDNRFRFKGMIKRLKNKKKSGSPEFAYSEEPLTVTFANGDAAYFQAGLRKNKEDYKFRFEARFPKDDAAQKKNEKSSELQNSDIRFNAKYSLLNSLTNQFVIRNAECALFYSKAEQNELCENKHIFNLDNGDRVLYWSTYDIENVVTDAYGVSTVTFLITRLYAINPEPKDADKLGGSIYAYTRLSESLAAIAKSSKGEKTDLFNAEKIVSTSFGKAVTIRPEENIEIDIPPDKETPLPFKLAEFISLDNSTTYISVDNTPEMIYAETPIYPQAAHKENIEGVVWVKAFVDKNGNVKSAYSIKCDMPGNGFEESAVTAAYNNKYKPATQAGRPVAIWISYKINFDLD